jgi:hypothetical protein
MNHPAELVLHQYLEDAANGKSTISEDTIERIAKDVADAVRRQFGGGRGSDGFRLRMSNIGRPSCQLWFEKNKPETSLPKPNSFVMNMLLGDIVEAVFKGVLVEAGIPFGESEHVTLSLGDTQISGTYDLTMNDAVDDVKSASDWSYRNKFESFDALSSGDSFGYVGQLAGYAKASGKRAGGWWVVNKANGQFKYVPADGIDMDAELGKLQSTVDTVNANEFKRCFDPEPETYRGKPTGNTVLNKNCTFCDYRFECWPTLKELPSKASQAREPKTVAYIEVKE